MWVHALGGKDPLEEDMATHSNFLAWRSPMDRGFPGGLQSLRSQRDTTEAIWHALGCLGFPGGSDSNAGDPGLIPGSG